MAMVSCEACKAEISSEATACPKCGQPSKATKKEKNSQAIWGIVVALGVAWFLFGGGLEQQTAKEMDKINDQVSSDMVKQYEIAKSHGDKMQICVQAGIVSASFLQAQDDANYKKWKSIEDADCRRAGLPR